MFFVVKKCLGGKVTGHGDNREGGGEGGILAAHRVVGEADSIVPVVGDSTLFLLTQTSPPAFLHLSSCNTFLTLPQIHGYQGTWSHYFSNGFLYTTQTLMDAVTKCYHLLKYLRVFRGNYFYL